MFVVRYLALAALVAWLGGTILLVSEGAGPGRLPPFEMMAAACGLIIVACLVVMKFVGPPPEAFPIRVVLAFVMTAVALFGGMFQRATAASRAINVAIGLVLLVWYARE